LDEIHIHYVDLITFISQVFPAYSPEILWEMDAKDFFHIAAGAKDVSEKRANKNK